MLTNEIIDFIKVNMKEQINYAIEELKAENYKLKQEIDSLRIDLRIVKEGKDI